MVLSGPFLGSVTQMAQPSLLVVMHDLTTVKYINSKRSSVVSPSHAEKNDFVSAVLIVSVPETRTEAMKSLCVCVFLCFYVFITVGNL